jgi:peroxiredoxin
MRIILLILFSFFTFHKPAFSQTDSTLLNRPVPYFKKETLDGKILESNNLKGKVLLINFWYIGCQPCMFEIKTLNKIFEQYKSDSLFKIIPFAPQTADQLRDFALSDDSTRYFVKIRKPLNGEKINYPLAALCEKERKKKKKKNHIILGPECNELISDFHFDGYPHTFLVDKNGIVRKINVGFAMENEKIKLMEQQLIKDIEELLKE